jgi:hypothetical protein
MILLKFRSPEVTLSYTFKYNTIEARNMPDVIEIKCEGKTGKAATIHNVVAALPISPSTEASSIESRGLEGIDRRSASSAESPYIGAIPE